MVLHLGRAGRGFAPRVERGLPPNNRAPFREYNSLGGRWRGGLGRPFRGQVAGNRFWGASQSAAGVARIRQSRSWWLVWGGGGRQEPGPVGPNPCPNVPGSTADGHQPTPVGWSLLPTRKIASASSSRTIRQESTGRAAARLRIEGRPSGSRVTLERSVETTGVQFFFPWREPRKASIFQLRFPRGLPQPPTLGSRPAQQCPVNRARALAGPLSALVWWAGCFPASIFLIGSENSPRRSISGMPLANRRPPPTFTRCCSQPVAGWCWTNQINGEPFARFRRPGAVLDRATGDGADRETTRWVNTIRTIKTNTPAIILRVPAARRELPTGKRPLLRYPSRKISKTSRRGGRPPNPLDRRLIIASGEGWKSFSRICPFYPAGQTVLDPARTH